MPLSHFSAVFWHLDKIDRRRRLPYFRIALKALSILVWEPARSYGRVVNLLCLCNRTTIPAVPTATRFRATARVNIEPAVEMPVPFPKDVRTVGGNARICITTRMEPCRFLLHTRIATPFAPVMQPSASVSTTKQHLFPPEAAIIRTAALR